MDKKTEQQIDFKMSQSVYLISQNEWNLAIKCLNEANNLVKDDYTHEARKLIPALIIDCINTLASIKRVNNRKDRLSDIMLKWKTVSYVRKEDSRNDE